MATSIYEVDGCGVFLGFDDGEIAGVTLPPLVQSYPLGEADFPEFEGRFAPPAGAELIASVCWNSTYRGYLGLAPNCNISGYHDIRHAYFLGRSNRLRWNWVLFMLHYDHDNEDWRWYVGAATDRAIDEPKEAARWLLESFWCWWAARAPRNVSPIDEVICAGLLNEGVMSQTSSRILDPWNPSGKVLFQVSGT